MEPGSAFLHRVVLSTKKNGFTPAALGVFAVCFAFEWQVYSWFTPTSGSLCFWLLLFVSDLPLVLSDAIECQCDFVRIDNSLTQISRRTSCRDTALLMQLAFLLKSRLREIQAIMPANAETLVAASLIERCEKKYADCKKRVSVLALWVRLGVNFMSFNVPILLCRYCFLVLGIALTWVFRCPQHPDAQTIRRVRNFATNQCKR